MHFDELWRHSKCGSDKIVVRKGIRGRDFLSYSIFETKLLDLIMCTPAHLVEVSIWVEISFLIAFSRRINFGRVPEILKTNRKLK